MAQDREKDPERVRDSLKDSRSRLQQIRWQVADSIGSLMELWGFKRIMGRTWALLYLSEQPLSAAELEEALQVSPGSVSMTVSELLKWGVVKKTWVPGDRRDFYQPETSIWKMVTRVIRERELVHVRETIEQLGGALRQLSALVSAGADAELDELRARVQALSSRIEALRNLSSLGQLLIEQLLSGHPVDPTPLHAALTSALGGNPIASSGAGGDSSGDDER